MDNEIKLGPDGKIMNIDTAPLDTTSQKLSSAGYDIETVIKSLKDEVGAVTSSPDTIDAGYNEAIKRQEEAALANQQKIESQYGRESGYLLDNLTQQRSAMLESRRGGATGTYALQLVDREIEKSMRDLESRKNELILQGNAAAANAISDLLVQQTRMRVDLQQQRIQNMTQLAGVGMQYRSMVKQEEQAARQSTMEQLRYNLDVQAQEDYRTKTAAELADMSIRTSIMKRELLLKEAADKREANLEALAGDEGWRDAGAQITFGAEITAAMEKIRAQGLGEAETAAAMALIVDDFDSKLPDGVATRDAIGRHVFGNAWGVTPEAAAEPTDSEMQYSGIFGIGGGIQSFGRGILNTTGTVLAGKYWTKME